MRRTALTLCAILMLAVAALSAGATAQKKDTSAKKANAANLPERIWQGAVDVPNYRERTKMEEITKHIPRADAKWLGQRLSKLTDDQIRDGFRAAGDRAGDVETLTKTIRQRIAALEAL